MEAVQIYNNPLILFKSESFIVLSNIAWTYLLHAYYHSIHIDYRYSEFRKSRKKYDKTKSGNYKYWELERCINYNKSPLDNQTSANLRFLISIRHEIEHHICTHIDEAIRGKIQASCINYNYYIKKMFGESFGIEKELGFSIQFSEITPSQEEQLKNNYQLPKNIRNFIIKFESELSDDEINGPRYEYKIVYDAYCSSRKSDSDKIIKFKKFDGTKNADEIIHIKEVEKRKLFMKEIIKMMQDEGHINFNSTAFLKLCKEKNARENPEYFVRIGDRSMWYDPWIKEVRDFCKRNKDYYIINPTV